jgi:hypothetical protein
METVSAKDCSAAVHCGKLFLLELLDSAVCLACMCFFIYLFGTKGFVVLLLGKFFYDRLCRWVLQ